MVNGGLQERKCERDEEAKSIKEILEQQSGLHRCVEEGAECFHILQKISLIYLQLEQFQFLLFFYL